ncbi:deoxyhypusine synthase [Methanosalsum zhilinae DSM 4017]|uniref:Deoxyhypusine synthase n=1 Tax=Methanosalsum zhilinae (strain DSM 4017 / NBRC 107636 / OCM 62 / WeN5) TaxID=679901 RepID=F7XMB0_METZD|nr:deoxyhypusine synthase family protein [Methanosalsum zhilinae]AEH61005.1 deoxyhypusine synthase [Methanosalsum zhilinae DSM 4017]
MKVTDFIDMNYRHFNAAQLKDAAASYKEHLDNNGQMLLTMAGAMSTAELGISLSQMIRQKKVHAICCTGANLEEDLFHLVAASKYIRIPDHRNLRKEDDYKLMKLHLNRVTDSCIPENEAMRRIESALLDHWQQVEQMGMREFPHESLYSLIRSGILEEYYEKNPSESWLVAACENNIPIFVPGWEDSTLGNMFASRCIKEHFDSPLIVRGGIEYMIDLVEWYKKTSQAHKVGFFQIGGGIAGDFPICAVPLINQDLSLLEGEEANIKTDMYDHPDLKRFHAPLWSYFCQISDSTTSYGSYSGAPPSEKISWGKLAVDTPAFMIESDATIVAPLIFAYVMEW